jgi:hypothetical protein
MPFEIRYGPIGSAVKMGAEAGKGEAKRFSIQAALQASQISSQDETRKAQIAMEEQRLRMADKQNQQANAIRQSQTAANERQFQANYALQQRQQSLREEQFGFEQEITPQRMQIDLIKATKSDPVDPSKHPAVAGAVKQLAALNSEIDDAWKGLDLVAPVNQYTRKREILDQKTYEAKMARLTELTGRRAELSDGMDRFLTNAVPEYKQFTEIKYGDQVYMGKPLKGPDGETGKLRPAGTSIMLGGSRFQLPAPPKPMTAPKPQTPLSNYPALIDPLIGYYRQAVDSFVQRGGLSVSNDQLNLGYNNFLSNNGWVYQ